MFDVTPGLTGANRGVVVMERSDAIEAPLGVTLLERQLPTAQRQACRPYDTGIICRLTEAYSSIEARSRFAAKRFSFDSVVFVLNIIDTHAAHASPEELPLGTAHLMTFQLTPIGPLNPLHQLLVPAVCRNLGANVR